MTIRSEVSESGDTIIISISGRFDFSAHQDFRDSYEGSEPDSLRYQVDMSETTYLDSSALGMLLLLRDFAGGDDGTVEILNCNPDVKKILTISNFEQLFSIH